MNVQRHVARAPKPCTHSRISAAVSAVLASVAQMYAPRVTAADVEEIIVTATRRSVSVSDIPYNISAVGEADIANAGVTDLQSLTRLIPGLVNPDLGPRASNTSGTLTIRGLNASAVNVHDQAIAAPLVSTYVDETPLFVNIKLTDIARVEVLRGPQGTLYGSGSVGGTVRLIHNKPDPTATEITLSTRASETANAANPSAAFDAVVNLPITETLAFRGSGGYEKFSGFTDAASLAVVDSHQQPVLVNPGDPVNSPQAFTRRRGIDSASTGYARGALLWKANDALEFTVSYQHQLDQSDGFSQSRPGYRYDQFLYVSQPGSYRTDLAALDVSLDAGFATITSSSSYTSQSADATFDETGLIETLYGGYPRPNSPIYSRSHDKAFTQELRLVSKNSGPWDWVAGGYYSQDKSDFSQIEPILGFGSWSELPGTGIPPGCTVLNAVSCPYPTYGDVIQYVNNGIRPSLNPYPDLNFTLNRHVSFSDVAAFSEVSYHFTDKWQATGGARIFWQHYEQSLIQTGPMCGVACSQSGTDPTGLVDDSNEKGFRSQIFKINTSYEIATQTLLYLTWSEGFRRGGVNALPFGTCFFCEAPSLLTYKPDKARNTEIGIKGSLSGASSYTLTLYNIDWSDPQIAASTLPGGFLFVANGNKARSRGVEAELALRVSDTTRIQFGYSYTDAILTASFQRGDDDLFGFSGDPLPGVSKQQGTVAVDYSRPLMGDRDFHAHIDGSYRSSFWTSLPHSPTAVELPGFALVNVRAGIGIAKSWRLDAFVNNLTNREAATTVSTIPGPDHNRANFVSRPRTAGLELHYSFKGH